MSTRKHACMHVYMSSCMCAHTCYRAQMCQCQPDENSEHLRAVRHDTRHTCLVELKTDFTHNERGGGGNSRDDLTGNAFTLQKRKQRAHQ